MSDTLPADPPDPAGEPTPPVDPPAEPDWKAEARKWESRAKADRKAAEDAAKALEAVQKQQMTDAEKAVDAARTEGRSEAAAEFGKLLAAAEVRAALTGVVPDPAAVVEDLDLGRYIGADGAVDGEKVAALRDRYAAMVPTTPPPAPLHQGPQGNGTPVPPQLTRAQIQSMTPEAIVEAKAKGQLNDLLGIT